MCSCDYTAASTEKAKVRIRARLIEFEKGQHRPVRVQIRAGFDGDFTDVTVLTDLPRTTATLMNFGASADDGKEFYSPTNHI
jgi:hypothetical protein